MTRYYVSRKLVCADCCIVEAKTKKEAIKKAKNNEFANLRSEVDNEETDWDTSTVLNTTCYKVDGIQEME